MKHELGNIGLAIVGPFLGIAYAILLPFIGLVILAMTGAMKTAAMFVSPSTVVFGWRPGEAYLKGKKDKKDS